MEKSNNLRSEKKSNLPSLVINNESFTHPQIIANKFAEFWTSISSDTTLDVNVVVLKLIMDIDRSCTEQVSLEVNIIELNEISRISSGSSLARDMIIHSKIKNIP